jgi:hypothetical protein
MSALVVMMLMLYVLLVALSLAIWATLTLRGSRRPGLAPEPERRERRAWTDDLPPVPAAFAAKPAPASDVHNTSRSRDDAARDGAARGAEGAISRSNQRVTVRNTEEAAPKKEREDAFDRFKDAGEEIDF